MKISRKSKASTKSDDWSFAYLQSLMKMIHSERGSIICNSKHQPKHLKWVYGIDWNYPWRKIRQHKFLKEDLNQGKTKFLSVNRNTYKISLMRNAFKLRLKLGWSKIKKYSEVNTSKTKRGNSGLWKIRFSYTVFSAFLKISWWQKWKISK